MVVIFAAALRSRGDADEIDPRMAWPSIWMGCKAQTAAIGLTGGCALLDNHPAPTGHPSTGGEF